MLSEQEFPKLISASGIPAPCWCSSPTDRFHKLFPPKAGLVNHKDPPLWRGEDQQQAKNDSFAFLFPFLFQKLFKLLI